MASRSANILLVHPKGSFPSSGFSLPLASIGGALKESGHHVTYALLYLPWNRRWKFDQIAKPIDIVGITVCSADYEAAVAVAQSVKRTSPNITVIAGGAHATFDPSSLLKNAFDVCVRGEGEFTVVEVVEKLLHNKGRKGSLDSVKGISYGLPDGRIFHNDGREIILDLDRLPLPDWFQDDYRRIFTQSSLRGWGAASRDLTGPKPYEVAIESSRGCPFHCVFCTASKIKGKKWRSKSATRVLAEYHHYKDFCDSVVADLHSRSGKFIRFVDDNFCVDRERVSEIGKAFWSLPKQARPEWSIMAHASKLQNREFLATMRRLGCVGIFIGAECGYSEGLGRIKKGQTLEMIESAIRAVLRANIPALTVSWIIGFPWESKSEALRTIIEAFRCAQKGPNIIRTAIYTFTPLPGAEITPSVGNSLKGKKSDFARSDSWGFEHPFMSNEELFELQVLSRHLSFLMLLSLPLSSEQQSYEMIFDEMIRLSRDIADIPDGPIAGLLSDIYPIYAKNIYSRERIVRTSQSKLPFWLSLLEKESRNCSIDRGSRGPVKSQFHAGNQRPSSWPS